MSIVKKVIDISEEMLQEIEALTKKYGYRHFSEFVRDALRRRIIELKEVEK